MKTLSKIVILLTLFVSIIANAYFGRQLAIIKSRESFREYLQKKIVEFHDVECLKDLELFGNEALIPYSMFLADVENNPDACALLFLAVSGFYNSKGISVMPQESFNAVFPYIKRAADSLHPTGICEMHGIYKDAIYVPKDSILLAHYDSLSRNLWSKSPVE